MESTSVHGVVGKRGFTLVELVVVLAIIAIITLVTITSQTNYNRHLILTDTVYTIALTLREAQTLGLSSRAFAGKPNAGYGVHFVKTPQTQYTLFADAFAPTGADPLCPANSRPSLCPAASTLPEGKPGNCLYDSGSSCQEEVTTFTINRGFKIADFCGILVSGGTSPRRCASVTTSAGLSSMDIVFLRPNTETFMTGITNGGNKVEFACAQIWVESPDGSTKKCISVSKVGQVSVPQTCPQDVATFTAC